MTPEQFRSIDALVATQVMGLSPEESIGVEQVEVWHRMKGKVRESGWNPVYPPYSTDIAAAWQVVEKVRSDTKTDNPGCFTIQEHDKGWEAGWGTYVDYEGFGFDLSVVADAAPLAICLAALKLKDIFIPDQD